MNKYIKAIIFLIAIGVLQGEFKGEIYARSGCCSHHGGVCGCGCCDGSALSSTCAPYYPECSGNAVKEPVRMVEPTAVPTRVPTAIPTRKAMPTDRPIPTARPTRSPTLIPTRKPTLTPTVKPTKIPTLIPTEVPVVTEKPIEITKEIKPTEATISSEVAKTEKVEVKRHSLLSKMIGWWRRR